MAPRGKGEGRFGLVLGESPVRELVKIGTIAPGGGGGSSLVMVMLG